MVRHHGTHAASIHPLGAGRRPRAIFAANGIQPLFRQFDHRQALLGLLADRFDLHRVMAIAILILAVALIALSQITATSMTLLYSYAIFAGLGFSGAFTCIQVLIAAHYSGPLYGRVLATLVLIDTLCGALGTQTVARLREWRGDYDMALLGMAMLAAVSAVVILRLARRSHSSVTMIS